MAEFFYKNVIQFKNFLYEKEILKEEKVNANVICVGNLTTGGVGKTPIVTTLANELSKNKRVAVISRGYGAKISIKEPVVIKDSKGIKFENGSVCGDEPYQLAKKTNNNIVVIICSNRKKAAELAIVKYGIEIIILDDGFSNRKIKKDKTILVIDSKMRFGNNCLLPKGPLREPVLEYKRADEIILVDKGDENIESAILWAKEEFDKSLKISRMTPSRIYNLQTKANVKLNNEKAIAFCAIGQPQQFFDFAKKYYNLTSEVVFSDHHKYLKEDIKKLINIAKKDGVTTFITTQKDETKLLPLVENISNYSFNILELETKIKEV